MSIYKDYYIDQGADFFTTLDLSNDDGTAINIAGYTFASSIRKSYYSANVTANLTIAIASAALGTINVSMNAATSANIEAGRYVYDVKVTANNGAFNRLLEGIVTVTPSVTGANNSGH